MSQFPIGARRSSGIYGRQVTNRSMGNGLAQLFSYLRLWLLYAGCEIYRPKNLTSSISRKPSETESRLQMNVNRKLRVAYHLSWSSLSSNCRKWRTWSGGRRRFAATDHRGDTACWATVCKTVRPMLSDRCLSCLSCLHVTLVYCGQTAG